MKFTDKVERHFRFGTTETEWDDVLRFHFKEEHTRVLVHTEFADWVDIVWRSNTSKGQKAIVVVAWMDLGEDEAPSGRTVKEYYDTNELLDSFKWVADNTT